MRRTDEWREIPGFPGYEASRSGHVRSAKPYAGVLRELAEWPNIHGYLTVRVLVNRRRIRVNVHRLVALSFLGPRPEGYAVAHWDGDPTNNAVSNLRYATPSENIKDQVRHGTHANARQTHCKRGHRLAGDNVRPRQDRPNARECRACRQLTGRALRERQAAHVRGGKKP